MINTNITSRQVGDACLVSGQKYRLKYSLGVYIFPRESYDLWLVESESGDYRLVCYTCKYGKVSIVALDTVDSLYWIHRHLTTIEGLLSDLHNLPFNTSDILSLPVSVLIDSIERKFYQRKD